jgi:hypothetical protein
MNLLLQEFLALFVLLSVFCFFSCQELQWSSSLKLDLSLTRPKRLPKGRQMPLLKLTSWSFLYLLSIYSNFLFVKLANASYSIVVGVSVVALVRRMAHRKMKFLTAVKGPLPLQHQVFKAVSHHQTSLRASPHYPHHPPFRKHFPWTIQAVWQTVTFSLHTIFPARSLLG